MGAMHGRAFRTLRFFALERGPESHSDGDSHRQPDSHVPSDYAENRTQRGSERYP
jgi:hypothetical protein